MSAAKRGKFNNIWIGVLGAADLFLFAIWFETLWSLSANYPKQTLIWWLPAQLILVPAIFLVLFLAEGFELAAATLIDKDPHFVESERDRTVLQALHKDPEFFFAQRQIFVVLIISLMTQFTDYDYITVPFVGSQAGIWSKLFSVIFTTLNVLWFGQVLPKRLAVLNPERFLRWSSYQIVGVSLWDAILFLSRIDIPALADAFVKLAMKIGFSATSRLLPPRPSTVYWISLQNRRVGWHGLEATITFDPADPRQLIEVVGTFVALRTRIIMPDRASSFFDPIITLPACTPGWGIPEEALQIGQSFQPTLTGVPELKIKAAYTGKQLAEEALQAELENVLETGTSSKLTPIRLTERPTSEGLWWIVSDWYEGDFLILHYNSKATIQLPTAQIKGAWNVHLDLPCRKLKLRVIVAPSHKIESAECAPVYFSSGAYGHGVPPREGIYATKGSDAASADWVFEYPTEGTLYRFLWETGLRSREE